MPERTYLFRSERLGFRNWFYSDIPRMAAINEDPQVMEFFPALQSELQTSLFIERMQKEFAGKGFCYFAVDKLENSGFIGFIGLSEKTFEAAFTPCIDIGWRLAAKEWNKGFATEGAKRCLAFAFQEAGLSEVFSLAPLVNRKSIAIMEKTGMQKVLEFRHPQLADDERLRDCVLYSAKKAV